MALRAQQDEVDYADVASDLVDLLQLVDQAEVQVGPHDYFESVRASAEDMLERVTTRQRATARQWRTVENWAAGIRKFL